MRKEMQIRRIEYIIANFKFNIKTKKYCTSDDALKLAEMIVDALEIDKKYVENIISDNYVVSHSKDGNVVWVQTWKNIADVLTKNIISIK